MRRESFVTSLLVALWCLTSASCGGTVPLNGSADAIRTERVWVDASRATPSNGSFGGAPTRTLRTLIWQPATTAPLPFVVMAHGFGALPEDFDAFARTVAGAGFILAAPAFPLTNQNAPGGQLGVNDLINQPGDLSFVITEVLQAANTAGDPLYGRIVPAQVAALGQSLGAATVIGLTRKDCCRDTRVQASILSSAPLLSNSFGPGSLSIGPPTLILHGTADTTVSFNTAKLLYNLIGPPRFLVGLEGAEHSDAVESQVEPPIPARADAQRATIAFLDAVFHSADVQLDAVLTSLSAEGNVVQEDSGSL